MAFCYGLGCDMAWVILLPSVAVQQHIQNEHTGHSSAHMPTSLNSLSWIQPLRNLFWSRSKGLKTDIAWLNCSDLNYFWKFANLLLMLQWSTVQENFILRDSALRNITFFENISFYICHLMPNKLLISRLHPWNVIPYL